MNGEPRNGYGGWTACSRFTAVRLCLAFLSALPGFAKAQAELDGDDIQALTARTVLGIVSYARWPVQPAVYRFCIVGNAANLRTLTAQPSDVSGRQFLVSAPVFDGDHGLSDCDIVYFGAMARSQRLATLKKTQARPVLTIAEDDELCSDGMMFCLDSTAQKTVLHANLDAISRSGIRINANVLLLLRPKATPP